ncbi:hypothetical protein IHQ68_07465 [Chelatococcus sambhunathii]|uniref:Uncharacterized protein n=1 Tax=Chelatococcus sambhunathii TaxID=363953 RepID=A0ABU1DEL1_9HYPH|nr:hypothetical protein [Chelatococcus sambhunathii]MDR4306454.1 hypothetical protein [Chelatococcus sambhunathii]
MAVAAAIVQQPAPKTLGVLASQQDRKVSEMRALLARLSPQSASESLRLLRNAFPDAPLSLRVAAVGLSAR